MWSKDPMSLSDESEFLSKGMEIHLSEVGRPGQGCLLPQDVHPDEVVHLHLVHLGAGAGRGGGGGLVLSHDSLSLFPQQSCCHFFHFPGAVCCCELRGSRCGWVEMEEARETDDSAVKVLFSYFCITERNTFIVGSASRIDVISLDRSWYPYKLKKEISSVCLLSS